MHESTQNPTTMRIAITPGVMAIPHFEYPRGGAPSTPDAGSAIPTQQPATESSDTRTLPLPEGHSQSSTQTSTSTLRAPTGTQHNTHAQHPAQQPSQGPQCGTHIIN